MKKISTFILAMMLAVSTAISAGAAEFTPSVQGKEAPDLVTTVNEAGEEVVAVVRDAQGNAVEDVLSGNLIVTPVAQADEAAENIRTSLQAAYEQIRNVSSLNELVPNLETVLAGVAPDVSVDELVVRDLFDVSVDEQVRALLEAGNSIELQFRLGVAADDLVICLHNYSEDNWEVIDQQNVVNDGDGSVTVRFTSLSPIAFAVKNTSGNSAATTAPVQNETAQQTATTAQDEVDGKPNPETGMMEGMGSIALAGAVAVAAGFGAVAVVRSKKK